MEDLRQMRDVLRTDAQHEHLVLFEMLVALEVQDEPRFIPKHRADGVLLPLSRCGRGGRGVRSQRHLYSWMK